MSFDISRFTFDPWNDYAGVVMEQGRVQLDSDWNEWLAEVSRRIRAGTLDIMGHAVYPATTPFAFQITASSAGGTNTISIGRGRMYVDGLLAENHGLFANAAWDPALAELSGSPQPPPATDASPLDFAQQPYYPGAAVPTGAGPFLVYLDVWTRPITYLQDPNLVDKAVAVDTTGRLQTVWQVKTMPVPTGSNWTCQTPDSEISYPPPSAGRLGTDVVPNPSAGPCCLSTSTGYTGVENQFYRLEIHQGGAANPLGQSTGATFKWSRDNASVATGVTVIANGSNSLNAPASVLTVLSLGRDQVLGFTPGNWIEILDDTLELANLHGELCQIDQIDFSARTITLTTTLAGFSAGTPDPKNNTRIRRWDQSGKVYEQDGTTVWWDLGSSGNKGIPVPVAGTTLILENGIIVTFSLDPTISNGAFNPGDFWTFAARTADGSVDKLVSAPPRGIHHHYTKLSLVGFGASPSYPDCRTPWGPSAQGDCGCCSCTVGDGVESHGKFTSIQTAIQSLLGTGGEVCILPGRYFEHVVINNSDVVIRGCGAQTRIASPSLNPAGTSSQAAGPGVTAQSGLSAVITVLGSQHIELRSFVVEADDGDVGILLDRAVDIVERKQMLAGGKIPIWRFNAFGDTDVVIEDLFITASTLPAILAVGADILKIANNRVAMADARTKWPAVYVSGTEIHVEQNQVGLCVAADSLEWAPASVVSDLAGSASTPARFSTLVSNRSLTPGGIQIAGPSQDVSIVDNEIEGGNRNGITLGNFVILDQTGADTGALTGVTIVEEDPCGATSTLYIPPTYGSGSGQVSLGAGGPLVDIRIERNRIRHMGLCGIGPVGFFDLAQAAEVLSIRNLAITGNAISSTLLNPLAAINGIAMGYGAIGVPDVQNLRIHDNVITDFGDKPGAEVCGIFVLHGEMAEISRNHVLETRDWTTDIKQAPGDSRAGILVKSIAPPALDTSGSDSKWTRAGALAAPIYEPGLPALRVEHNVVRVALGVALEAIGFGPFSIVNNHFSSGGTVTLSETSKTPSPAMTVLILNFGLSIEIANWFRFRYLYNSDKALPKSGVGNTSAVTASGMVLFTNNICQLVTRASGEKGIASVLIGSLDHVLFANNHCWLDGPELSAGFDALLVAMTLQANSNRLQETMGSVLASGFTFGLVNSTAQNISTTWLIAAGPNLSDVNNLMVI